MRYLHHVLAASALVAAPFLAVPAQAQVTSKVLSACGTASYTAGTSQYPTMDTTGVGCTAGNGSTSTVTNKGFVSTDASGTVATGNTYQTVFASSAARHGCTIQNPTTATEALNVRVTGATVYTLSAGSVFTCGFPGGVVTSLIEVTAATSTHAFSAASQ